MGILLICENCNWEIIPMLLVAWLLGMLFWVAFFRNRSMNKSNTLDTQLKKTKLQLEKGKRDLEAAQYKNQKLIDDIVNLNKRIKSLEFQVEQLERER